jgi:hypothetical protein
LEFQGDETWACYCHCDDWRRNCGAPVVAFIGVKLDKFAWTGKAPRHYVSSKGVKRHFCDNCGSPMGFEADHNEGEIHVYAASLAHPEIFEPKFHVHAEENLPWLRIEDALPRHDKSIT